MTVKYICLGLLITGAGSALSVATAAPSEKIFVPTEASEDEIIVRGTRLGLSVDETPSSVTIITEETIRAFGDNLVSDTLRRVPGVTLNSNGAFGGLSTIRLRGSLSEQVLTLIDGIPVSDPTSPGGGFDYAALQAGGIERIEILRGAQSTLWGSDAMGGVISIETAQPTPGLAGDFLVEAGTYDTFRTVGAVSLATAEHALRLGVADTRTNGISKADEADGNTERDGATFTTLSANTTHQFGSSARLTTSLRHTETDLELDGFPPPTFALSDTDDSSTSEEFSGHARLHIDRNNWQYDVSGGRYTIERENFSGDVPTFATEGERDILRGQLTWADRVAVGAEYESTESNGTAVDTQAAFILVRQDLGDRTLLTGGVRYTDHETFGGETTGQAGLRYMLTEQLTLRANWAQGFKAPTPFQLTSAFDPRAATDPAFAPNSDLRPESSEEWEVALDWQAEGQRPAAFSIAAFTRETTDQIDFDFIFSNYQNIAEVNVDGVEVSGDVTPVPTLTFSGQATFLSAEDGTGRALIRVPEIAGQLSAQWQPKERLSTFVTVLYNGEEPDTFTDVDAWTRVDLGGQWQLTDALQLTARLENAFDESYQDVAGYGTPGRSGTVGLRWTGSSQ